MTSARTCSKGVCVNLVLQRSARVLVHDLVIFVPARYVSKGRNKFHQTTYQDLSQRKGAKFGEESSVRGHAHMTSALRGREGVG